jgi:hypothetical protein
MQGRTRGFMKLPGRGVGGRGLVGKDYWSGDVEGLRVGMSRPCSAVRSIQVVGFGTGDMTRRLQPDLVAWWPRRREVGAHPKVDVLHRLTCVEEVPGGGRSHGMRGMMLDAAFDHRRLIERNPEKRNGSEGRGGTHGRFLVGIPRRSEGGVGSQVLL